MAYWLTAVSTLGAALLVYGLSVLDFGLTLGGMLVAVVSKVWFVDRMVWLYRDVTHVPARDGPDKDT